MNVHKQQTVQSPKNEFQEKKLNDFPVNLSYVGSNFQLREDTRLGVYVENLSCHLVNSIADVERLLVQGSANRKVASTAMNLESSRSHSVFSCSIASESKSKKNGVSAVRFSRLSLVDLAGSERQKLTQAGGDRLREAGSINKSLSQLGYTKPQILCLFSSRNGHFNSFFGGLFQKCDQNFG